VGITEAIVQQLHRPAMGGHIEVLREFTWKVYASGNAWNILNRNTSCQHMLEVLGATGWI